MSDPQNIPQCGGGTVDVGELENREDALTLDLIMYYQGPGHLTVGEIQREIGSGVGVIDALNRLVGGGLVHRHDDFVFPTKSATYAHRLKENL